MEADLLIAHGNVATLEGPDGPREATAMSEVPIHVDWSIAVAGDRILWAGPAQEWEGDADRTVDATGRLVTPGYVDAHNHLVYGGDRAFEIAMKLAGKQYLEILAAGGGIAYTVGQTRAAGVAGLVQQAQARMERMLRAGTTTFEAKSGYGLDEATELAMLEAAHRLGSAMDVPVVPTFLGAHAVPEGTDADAYTQAVIDMLPAVKAQGHARFCDAFVEQDVFTPEHGAAIFDAAKRHGLGLRLHADEIVNTGGAELAAQAGCISADHLLRVSPSGIAAMAEAGTMATLMPTVPLTLMQPEWAPARAMLDAGIPVALATDHNPNNPVTSMGLVAQLGCFAMGLSPAQALTAVTHNAACALERPDVGRIAQGLRADVLVHEVADLDHWVYEPGRQTVQTVISGGRVR